jgi:hypothetical protein
MDEQMGGWMDWGIIVKAIFIAYSNQENNFRKVA